jgi:hypothetical protein
MVTAGASLGSRWIPFKEQEREDLMISRIVRLIVLSLVAGLISLGASTAASASTGDYYSQCTVYGTQIVTFNMYKGEPLSDCRGGYVYVRLDGNLVHTYPITPNGTAALRTFTLAQAGCFLFTVAGGYTAVISVTGVVGRVVYAGGLLLCRAW